MLHQYHTRARVATTKTKLLNDAATSAILFGSINRPAKAWWSPEVADAIAKRRKVFAKAHCSEEDRQNYISISRYTATVISKAKAKSWQKTCSSLSPKTRPNEVFSLLRSISGPPPQLHLTSPTSQVAIPCRLCQPYLFISTIPFLYSNPKTFSKHRDKSYQNCTLQHPALHFLLTILFSCLNSQVLIKLPTPFNPPSTICVTLSSIYLQPFLVNSHLPIYRTWKQSTIIPILKPGKPSNSPSSYRPISLTFCTSKLFKRMVLGRLTYFLEQQGTLSPMRAGFRLGRSIVDQVLLLSVNRRFLPPI